MDERAAELRALYERHAPGIRRYVARLVGEDDAEDLTQEVFARAHRALATHRGDALVSTWLYRIATNAAVDRLRAASRREVPVATAAGTLEGGCEEGCGSSAADTLEPDQQLIRSEMRDCILELVDRLPPADRAVILLAELRDVRDRQIAETLGISLEAAKMRLHRARSRLKALLQASCDLYRDERNELACDRKPASRR